MTISNEAVEVALAAQHKYDVRPGNWDAKESVRAALEAAGPVIQAEALQETADAWREYLPAVAGYGVVQPVPVWLERRAEWLRAETKEQDNE